MDQTLSATMKKTLATNPALFTACDRLLASAGLTNTTETRRLRLLATLASLDALLKELAL